MASVITGRLMKNDRASFRHFFAIWLFIINTHK